MRNVCIWMVLFNLAAFGAARDESVEDLKSRVQNAAPQERIDICVRIAELQLRSADKSYVNGDIERARAAVDDIVTFSEKAHDSSIETRKHLKNTEIAIRKISDKLKDIKRTLAFDDQPHVQRAIERLEDLRTSLLKEMFKKERK